MRGLQNHHPDHRIQSFPCHVVEYKAHPFPHWSYGAVSSYISSENNSSLAQEALIAFASGWIELEDPRFRISPYRPAWSFSASCNLQDDIAVCYEDNRVLWSLAEPLTDPLRSVGRSSGVRAPESTLGSPLRLQQGEIELSIFRVGLQFFAIGADIALPVVTLLCLGQTNDFLQPA